MYFKTTYMNDKYNILFMDLNIILKEKLYINLYMTCIILEDDKSYRKNLQVGCDKMH